MKKTFLFIIVGVTCALFPLFSSHLSAGEMLIAHPGVAEDTLSRSELRNIYLGKKGLWGNGNRIFFVVQESGETHKAFLKKNVGKTHQSYNRFWRKKTFGGAARPPTTRSSDAAVVEFVLSQEGALGYIDSGSAHEGVKELRVR